MRTLVRSSSVTQQNSEPRVQSYGERLVRLSFNPSGNELVDQIKQKTAELIDLLHDQRWSREASLAITAYETAAMWAVKVATA